MSLEPSQDTPHALRAMHADCQTAATAATAACANCAPGKQLMPTRSASAAQPRLNHTQSPCLACCQASLAILLLSMMLQCKQADQVPSGAPDLAPATHSAHPHTLLVLVLSACLRQALLQPVWASRPALNCTQDHQAPATRHPSCTALALALTLAGQTLYCESLTDKKTIYHQ